MPEIALKRISLRIPRDVSDIFSSREILALLRDKALSKAESYRSKCQTMAHQYHTDIQAFRAQLDADREEHFTAWDDLLLWEGYEQAY